MRTVGLIAVVFFFVAFAPVPAGAQGPGTPDPEPPIAVTDRNGADLFTGTARLSIPLLKYGSSARPLEVSLSLASPSQNLISHSSSLANDIGIEVNSGLSTEFGAEGGTSGVYNSIVRVRMPGANGFYRSDSSVRIYNSDGSYYQPPVGQFGPTYLYSNDTSKRDIYAPDGTRLRMPSTTLKYIDFPDGETWTLYYRASGMSGWGNPTRLEFLVSSRGYGLQYSYFSESTSSTTVGKWLAPTKIVFYNKTTVYCDESTLNDCSAVSSLATAATLDYDDTNKTLTVKRPGEINGVQVTIGSQGFAKYKNLAVSGSDRDYQYTFSSNWNAYYLSRVTDADGEWNYAFTPMIPEDGNWEAGTGIGTRTDPASNQITFTGELWNSYPTVQRDELNRETIVEWARGKLVRSIRSGGAVHNYTADVRGNVTSLTLYPSTGPTSSDPTTTFSFPADCINPATCNKPTAVTDPNGNVTTFTYDANHGGVLTEQSPAVGGISSVKRYTYAQRTAYVSNGSGGYQAAGNPIWLRTEERFCKSTATVGSVCAGGSSDEVVTSYEYGSTTGLNNLLPRGVVVTADGSSRRTCFGYDVNGNKIFETTARAALSVCN